MSAVAPPPGQSPGPSPGATPDPTSTPSTPTGQTGGAGRRPAVAVVLGAGGVPGFAYLVGTLAALEHATGWDSRDAELVVGTSAGAGVAALLRAGLSAADQYAHALGRPVSPEAEERYASTPTTRWDEGELTVASSRPAAPLLAVRGLLRWPPRPGLALAGAVARGRRSTTPMGDRYRALLPAWPDRHLWLCALRMADGRRVTFGRDDHPPVDVGTAVEASSAVPGFFRPVTIGGSDYVDGGVWSATNADLVAGVGFDTVVVVAPLSATRDALALDRNSVNRAYHRSVLQAELQRVRATGTATIVVEPTRADVDVLTGDPLAGGPRVDVAEQAFASMTARLLQDPSLGHLVTEPAAR